GDTYASGRPVSIQSPMNSLACRKIGYAWYKEKAQHGPCEVDNAIFDLTKFNDHKIEFFVNTIRYTNEAKKK
ncbi:1748_t:CDS:2, partial [Scutellospora calospora]